MTNARLSLVASLAFLPAVTHASFITIEPDNYASGTKVTHITPYATITTPDGRDVYATNVEPDPYPYVHTTGVLNQRTFSDSPTRSGDWFNWPEIEYDELNVYNRDVWAYYEPYAFMVEFNTPVNYVSLFAAETNDDSGGPLGDNLHWWIYDSNDRLIHYGWPDRDVVMYLGQMQLDYEDPNSWIPAYPVWLAQFASSDIKRIIIGGESEGTTLDRLVFNTVPVPEPGSMGLLVGALMMAGLARRKRSA